MLLLLLIFPFAEAFMFYKFIQAYSFLDAVFLVMLSGVLGVVIMKMQGKATLLHFQRDLMSGKLPDKQILHRALVVVGGLLLFVPGIISDILGILCILPGSRHLFAWYLKKMFQKGLLKGSVYFGGFGAGRPSGPSMGNMGGMRGGFTYREQAPLERDAQVVDIEPIEITHQKKTDS